MDDNTQKLIEQLYSERAELISLLTKQYPASVEHDESQPDWPVVIVDLPSGQVSWHVAQADMDLFEHLPQFRNLRHWDGHSTDEKRDRVRKQIGLSVLLWKSYYHPQHQEKRNV